jgi:NADH:ubiquinone oxidoreductase subunit 2 (subunit N)
VQVVFAVVEVGYVPLGVIAMVTAVVAAYFYLRIAVLMYAGGGLGEPEAVTGDSAPAGDLATGTTAVAAAPSPLTITPSWAGPEVAAGTVATLNDHILLADEEPEGADDLPEAVSVPVLTTVSIALCTGVTVVFGFWPQPLIDFANHATLLFLPK